MAVLNGGYNKWVREKKPVSKESIQPTPVAHRAKPNKAMFVSKDYVKKRAQKPALIVDARAPTDFFGVTQDLFTERAGHIPGATCLPAPWVWTEKGTYRNIRELRGMALGVVGRDKSREIIIYCGVGGYSSTWWFVLTELLGYRDVKIYDGSAQEWTRDPEAPVVKYRWN